MERRPIPTAEKFTCSEHGDYVQLRYHADFPSDDLLAHQRVVDAIDRALRRTKCRLVLFDTREFATPPEAARELCWKWTQARVHHDRVALVANSPRIQVQGNMTAQARKATLRSFGDMEEALRWLRGR